MGGSLVGSLPGKAGYSQQGDMIRNVITELLVWFQYLSSLSPTTFRKNNLMFEFIKDSYFLIANDKRNKSTGRFIPNSSV